MKGNKAMTLDITLNKDDIAKAIAKAYNTNPDNVRVYISSETTGYGIGEKEENTIKAKITITEND